MAETSTLHDAFLEELRDMYHAEKQLTSALPKMAEAASSPSLVEAFESHLVETENHVARLEQVFESERVRQLRMRREDLPGHRDGSSPYVTAPTPSAAAAEGKK